MSIRISWHPVDVAYHARADESGETFWVELSDGSGAERIEVIFFFPTQSQARAVAAAFNDGPQPQIDDNPQLETKGVPDGPDN